MLGVADTVRETLWHYSKLKSWKELFLIPYKRTSTHRKKKRKNNGFTLERTLTLDKFGRMDQYYSDSNSDAKSDSKSDYHSDSNSDGKPDSKSDYHSDSNSDGKPGGKPDSKSDYHSDSNSDGKPDSNSGSRSDSSTSSSSSSLSASSKDREGGDKGGRQSEEVEVRDDKYMYDNVYFARSSTPRVNRPEHVALRVGDVVRHKEQGLYGVVIGWDEHAVVRIVSLGGWWARGGNNSYSFMNL